MQEIKTTKEIINWIYDTIIHYKKLISMENMLMIDILKELQGKIK